MDHPKKAGDLSVRKTGAFWAFGLAATGSAVLLSGYFFWPDPVSLIPIPLIRVITSASKQWFPAVGFCSQIKVQEYFGV